MLLLGHLHQQRCWREATAKPTFQITQLCQQISRTQLVDITERPSQKWRKADAKDSANIAIACRGNNTLFQRTYRFVQHLYHTAAANFVTIKPGRGRNTQHAVYCLVDQLFAFFGIFTIQVKAFFGFFAFAAISQQFVKCTGRDKAIAEFADRYADQNERDYDALLAAEADGRIEVRRGL